MSLLWITAAGDDCPGGLDQYEHHECEPGVVKIHDKDRFVMVMQHGRRANGYASHRPAEGDGSSVGEAAFDEDGTMSNIGVAPHHQRQGYGRMIWDAANHLADRGETSRPKHSVERTDAGDAWAQSVGGEVPTDRKRVFR